MQPDTVANIDAVSLLERVDDASVTLLYFDPPVAREEDPPDNRRRISSLYLHSTLQAQRVLSDSGVLVWHTYPESAPEVRNDLDRIFGANLFATEIVLKRRARQRSTIFPRPDHTSLVVFSKTGEFHYKPPTRAVSRDRKAMYSRKDPNGPYRLTDVTSSLNRPRLQFSWRGHTPPAGRSWRHTLERLEELYSSGRIQVAEGQFPRLKAYLSEAPDEEVGSIWDDIDLPHAERISVELPGQQSLALMSRIVSMVTEVGDLIVDPFCGTGTMPVAAEQSQRRWIAGDLSLNACEQTVARVLQQTGRAQVLAESDARRLPIRKATADLIRVLQPKTNSTSLDTHELLASAESKTLEFKQTLSLDLRTGSKEKFIELMSLKSIAAFLNTDGGTLLVGVSDSRQALGVNDEINRFYDGSSDKFLLHFTNLIRSNIGEGFLPFLEHYFVQINTNQVLRVDCERSDRPCYIGIEFYVRTNPATTKLEGPKLVDYVMTHFPKGRG